MSFSEPKSKNYQNVVFLQEQDGVSERELKAELSKYFTGSRSVKRAYLSRVQFVDVGNDFNVVLCLVISINVPEETILNKIASIFGSMFGKHEHLDVLFLSVDQEVRVSRVCRPFFVED
jgi:hypothetical protein